jgi:hypothetical protein
LHFTFRIPQVFLIKPSLTSSFQNGRFFLTFSIKCTDMGFQLVDGRPDAGDHLVFTTNFSHNDVYYIAALAETVSWEGLVTGTYDVLLQSHKGTQRLTLVRFGEQWRAGNEIEQIGVVQQGVVDKLGEVISEVRR